MQGFRSQRVLPVLQWKELAKCNDLVVMMRMITESMAT